MPAEVACLIFFSVWILSFPRTIYRRRQRGNEPQEDAPRLISGGLFGRKGEEVEEVEEVEEDEEVGTTTKCLKNSSS